jgi:hypothetical protein
MTVYDFNPFPKDKKHPRERRGDFRKNCQSLVLWEPSCTAVGNSETNCKRRKQLYLRPFIHYIQLLAAAPMNKLGSCCQWRHEYLKSSMLLVSVANGAMNERQHWELRNECLTKIWNCPKNVFPKLRTAQRVYFRHRNCAKSVLPMLRPVWILSALQREWGTPEPLKNPTDKNAAYPCGSMNFYSLTGNLFPNSQQLYDVACGAVNWKGSHNMENASRLTL